VSLTDTSMDLSAHTSLAPLAEAVAAVRGAASATALEIYIAGALARDLWLEFAHDINAGRRTADADFAVECADWSSFERLRAALLSGGDVVQVGGQQHKFRHRNGTELDLVPYGGVERANRTLAWPPEGDQVMNALGFSEVASTTVKFLLPGGVDVQVVPLHALALLKLVAWDDRRQPKDAHDLFVIAKNYLDAGNSDRLYETGLDIVMREDFDTDTAGAELLGRDLASLCRGTTRLRNFTVDLLKRETDDRGHLLLASQMMHMTRDDDLALSLLVAVKRGVEFGLPAP
jgi:predicted nucleotidyltransferase